MKTRIMLAIVVFCLLVSAISAAEAKQAIAIMDFQPKGADASSASIVSDLFRDFIVSHNLFIVVDRASMQSILQEQNLQQELNCSSEECAVNLGKILGVTNIVIGTLGKLGNVSIISARMVNIENAKIEWSRSAKVVDFSQIDVIINALVNDMLKTIFSGKANIPVTTATPAKAQQQQPQQQIQQQQQQTQQNTDYYKPKQNTGQQGSSDSGQNVIVVQQGQQNYAPAVQRPTQQTTDQVGLYYLYTQRKKSGGTAFLLSFFIPTLGNFYAGEPGRAVGYLLLEGLEWGAYMFGMGMDYDSYYDSYYGYWVDEISPVATALMIGGSVLFLLTRIMEVIDAPAAASRYNAKLMRQMKLAEVDLRFDTKSNALKLSYAFRF